MKSGAAIDGRIVSADEVGMVVRSGRKGEARQLAYSDMQSMQVRRVSWPRTLGAVGGGVLIYLLVGFFILISALSGS